MTSALIFFTILLVVLVLESLFRFGVIERTVMFWVGLVSLVTGVVWTTGRPALRLFGLLTDDDDQHTAATVGNAFPRIHDRLVNLLQLYEERKKSAPYYSVNLIDASFVELERDFRGLDFSSVAGYSESGRVARGLGVVAGVVLLLFLVSPGVFLGALNRALHFQQAFATPVPFTLIVEPGDKEVVKGERVDITVRAIGNPPEKVFLSSRPERQLEYDEVQCSRSGEDVFQYSFSVMKSTTRYFVHSGQVRSNDYTLAVHDRPVIKLLRLVLDYPQYSRVATLQLDDNIGDVAALQGTRIQYRVEASKELSAGMLVFRNGDTVSLNIQSRQAIGTTRLVEDGTYYIRLRDRDGTENADPIEYTQRVLPDAYPTVSVLVPGTDLDIAENTGLDMMMKITDDFGFSSLRLAYKLVHSRYEKPADTYSIVSIPIPAGVRTEEIVPYHWSLSALTLVPEDVVQYFVEVTDNDRIVGPKSSVSEIYLLRLPSLDEVFAALDESHAASLERLQEAMERAEEAHDEFQQLQQDLRKDQEKMDWQDQQRAQSLVEEYEEIKQKMDEASEMVRQMTDDLESKQLLSDQTLEKYQELQRVMQEMDSAEFAEAMNKLQEAMRGISPEAMRQALERMEFSEDAFRKSIERTINLLKRIHIEQKVDELLRRTEEMAERQEALRQRTEELNPNDGEKLEELTREQADLQEMFEELRQGLEELQKKMEEFPAEMPLDEMAGVRNTLDRSNLENDLQDIVEQLQGMQMQDAHDRQTTAVQKIDDIMQQMQEMQDALRAHQQREIVNAMQRSLQDMIELSKRQERLKNEAEKVQPNSSRFRELAQEQMELARDLASLTSRLVSLSQKTFGITPEMGKSIGDAMREMHAALNSLERRNGGSARGQQESAMSSLNEAAQLMQWSLNAMMQGGQGVGMAGFMQRLQQMTGQQRGINQGTRNLGEMTQQQAAALARLAGEQGAVRKSLEQMAREAASVGELSKVLGDLNRIAREMREVQTDLAQGNINPETLRKQDRILSRLLDSQRSLRERDFERRRRAESGTNVKRLSPGRIDLTSQEGKNRLREDLLKALQEGYTRDYEELIRKYFEVLEQ
jgi:hypothetical protein